MTTNGDAAADAETVGAASDADWEAQIRANRDEKDEFFAEHPQSPLDAADRDGFDGLDYFEPAPEYRVEADVAVHDDPEPLELTVDDAPNQRFLRVATFTFELPNADGEPVEQSLCAYRQEGADALFVPFRDKTTGQQTYDGGRYMDLHPDGDLGDDDPVTVDFNLAYTPFCAFNDAFACPLPPTENWLDVAVPAGEKAP
ncbi:DUF1684 domain-containing protein [Halobaculum sp. P14]|uniref:DUF1684 domain-containing protein n=1 Tax=Halobaculum sp. P14 TaxID=3421638 RepID=UPI003EBAD3C6